MTDEQVRAIADMAQTWSEATPEERQEAIEEVARPSYRQRRLAKAERLRGWAEKREQTATAALNSHPEMRNDWAFITQPGHIPARERMNRSDERAYASLEKAESMASRADGIEAAASNAIYSDDPDAIEALEKRIEGLEAERDRVKAYNASARKAKSAKGGDWSILTDRQQRELAIAISTWGDVQCKHGIFPSYHLSNLSGNINRQKKRLEHLKRRAELYHTGKHETEER